MGHTVKQVEALRMTLSALPPIDDGERELSKRQAIAMLARDIRDLQRKGYTYEMIAQALSSNGLDMSVATLKSYITKANRTMKRGGGQRSQSNARKPTIEVDKKNKSSPQEPNARRQDAPSALTTRSSSFTPRNDSADI
jgi:hypothetical protein